MVKSRSVLGMGDLPTFNDGILVVGILSPYYWVDDHPLLYGNNGSLDPGAYVLGMFWRSKYFSQEVFWMSN